MLTYFTLLTLLTLLTYFTLLTLLTYFTLLTYPAKKLDCKLIEVPKARMLEC